MTQGRSRIPDKPAGEPPFTGETGLEAPARTTVSDIQPPAGRPRRPSCFQGGAIVFWLALFLLQTPCPAQTSGASAAQPLEAEAVVERELGVGDRHVYSLNLGEQELVNLVVEQRQIDLRLRLTGPDGELVAEVDRGSSGSEQLMWICPQAGIYLLELEATGESADPGGYRLRVPAIRPATAEDEILLEAQAAYTEALALRARDTADSIRQAIERYREALPLWRQLDQKRAVASTLNNLGSAYMSLGEAHRALEYYEQALTLWRDLEDRKGEADTLKAAATAHYTLGQIDTALEGYAQALELSRLLKDRSQELRVLYNIGAVYRRRGESQQALDYLLQALALRQEQKDRKGEAATLNGIAVVYLGHGEPDRALPFLERALELNREQQDHSAEAATRLNLGSVYDGIENWEKARVQYQRSLELSVETGKRSLQAQVLNNLGWNLSRKASLLDSKASESMRHQALEHFRQALALSRASGDLQTEAIALDNIGEVLTTLRRLEEALQHFSQALPLRRAVYDRAGEAGTLAGMAVVERIRGRLRQARFLLEEALEITEDLRSNAPSHRLRSSFFASKHQYYELYLQVLMQQHEHEPEAGHDAAALVASERARARSLLELLTESNIDIESGIDPALKLEERELASRLNHIQNRILSLRRAGDAAAERVETWQEEWRQVEQERERLEWQIRRSYPQYAVLQYPRALAPEEIRNLLAPDAALLEYSLGTERSFLFVVTNEDLRVYELPAADRIAELVQDALKGLRQPGRRELGRYLASSFNLYQTLIAPALEGLGERKRLLIAPDRSLYFLAFESLLTQPPSRTAHQPMGQLPFLLKRWAISYVPSATVLQQLQAKKPSAPEDEGRRKALVAFADPFYGTGEETGDGDSVLGQLPAPDQPQVPGPLRTPPSLGTFPAPQRLSESGREAEEIADLFSREDVSLFVREAAREENVKDNALVKGARRLHFATHAMADEERPEFSGLILSRPAETNGRREPGASGEDGLLQVYEIFNLRLEAELVTLSACETGLGKAVNGEGVIGLTQAFLYAGAPSLVVSLWQVADRSTADLMVSFYRHLETAPTKAEALRQAKLEIIAKGRYAHPFHWAPFVLVGRP